MKLFDVRCRVLYIRIGLALTIAITFTGVSVLRSLGFFKNDIYWLQEALGGDKMTHLLMGFGVMVAAYLVVLPGSLTQVFKILCATLSLLLLEEFSQILFDTREFDWLDLSMGVVGATLAYAGFYSYLKFDRERT